MQKNVGMFPAALVLALAIPALTGCDQVKSSIAKFSKSPATKAPVAKGPSNPAQISEVSGSNYKEFIARKSAVVVVDYHATWCGPCKVLAPVLVKATEEHPGVVFLGKVDVDQSKELAQEQKVSAIPDVRIFKDGVEVDRFVGYPGEKEVLAKIAKYTVGVQAAPPEPAKQATVKPFEKDWLPPGVTRQKPVVPETK